MHENRSIQFFETQFARQVREREFALNPFETLALEHLRGSVLDLGCGLGNLSLAAARRGHHVVALDASKTAIARLDAEARREQLPLRAVRTEITSASIDQPYDTLVAIGLLMFFPRAAALILLSSIQAHVTPGGRAIVNTLIEGTTFHDMFEPGHHCLLQRDELAERFSGWRILLQRQDSFPAPGGTRKDFATVVAEKPPQRVRA